jgi:hypothetical protein
LLEVDPDPPCGNIEIADRGRAGRCPPLDDGRGGLPLPGGLGNWRSDIAALPPRV